LLLASCNNKLAQKCAETYPCKDSTTYVGIGIPDSTPYIEFVKVPYPEIHRKDSVIWKDSISYVPVIKWKAGTKERVEKIVKVRDTAKEKVLQDKIDELETQLQKSESKPDVKLPWWIAVIVAVFGYGLYRGTKKQQ
jgi:hypothetical protein